MDPTLGVTHLLRGHRTSRLAFFRSHMMTLCLCVTALSVPGARLCASTPSQLPLFVDTPSDVPPAIAQAFPSHDMAKHLVRQHRTLGLNYAALDAMKRARKETKPDITLDLFDAGSRTLELDEPKTHRNKATVWRGGLRGEQDNDVTLAVRGTKMVGTITSGQRLYKIEPTENNRHRLVEIDDAAMPPDHHPIVVPDDGTPADPPAPEPNLKQPGTPASATDSVTTAASHRKRTTTTTTTPTTTTTDTTNTIRRFIGRLHPDRPRQAGWHNCDERVGRHGE